VAVVEHDQSVPEPPTGVIAAGNVVTSVRALSSGPEVDDTTDAAV
jgi:hypothetical protein